MEANTKKSKPVQIEVYHRGVKKKNQELLDRQCTPEKELKDFIKSLSPRPVGHDLIRIGHTADGGYLVPDDLEGIKACFSIGYGGVSVFEEMLGIQYEIKAFIADRVGKIMDRPLDWFIKWLRRLIRRRSKIFRFDLELDFENKYVGKENNLTTIRLEDWIQKKCGLDSMGDLILQMDVEGTELDVLIDTPSDVLRKFRMMVIEFHDMKIFDLSIFLRFKSVFDKILEDFCVAHIHPNSSSRRFFFRGIEIPVTMEFTFIRKDRVLPDNQELVFPHKLDRPNSPNGSEVVLPEIWQNRNKTAHASPPPHGAVEKV